MVAGMAISSSVSERGRAAKALRTLLATAAVVPLVAACGSSSPSKRSQSTSTPASEPAAATATVSTAKVTGYGEALSTGKGTTLFLFTGKSGCTGACTKVWVPLTVSGKPSAGGSAQASLLSTVELPDGDEQVTYAGHPLYTHAGGVNAVTVAGSASDGGIWYLVAATGKPITKTNSNGY